MTGLPIVEVLGLRNEEWFPERLVVTFNMGVESLPLTFLITSGRCGSDVGISEIHRSKFSSPPPPIKELRGSERTGRSFFTLPCREMHDNLNLSVRELQPLTYKTTLAILTPKSDNLQRKIYISTNSCQNIIRRQELSYTMTHVQLRRYRYKWSCSVPNTPQRMSQMPWEMRINGIFASLYKAAHANQGEPCPQDLIKVSGSVRPSISRLLIFHCAALDRPISSTFPTQSLQNNNMDAIRYGGPTREEAEIQSKCPLMTSDDPARTRSHEFLPESNNTCKKRPLALARNYARHLINSPTVRINYDKGTGLIPAAISAVLCQDIG
ncbi:hypothetical protein J6590_055862 [Homalodisca vitripennis]|nr:hypothetical protein J6590_055862 [Homalodisca vitripennis]